MSSLAAQTLSNGHGATSRLRALWSHRWFILAALVLVSLGAYEGARLWLGPAVVVDRVQTGPLVESVVATGNVLTPFRVQIGAQITGTVVDVLVDEGQRVTKGQTLVKLEDREFQGAVVLAQGALAEAEAKTRQLKELTLPTAQETLRLQQANLLDAQKTYDRTENLAKTGAATQAALDDARKALDVARAQVNAAELSVYTASPGGSDYVLAESQLNQARAALDAANARLSYTTVKAPRDGVLISRNVEVGAVVQPGTQLLALAPDGVTQIEIAVDERNLGKIAIGQKATVSADAYPDDRFEAKVSYINPGVDIARATVEAKLDVPSPPAYLRQDMTVSVDIEVARKAATLVLPSRSVHDALSGSPWVLTIKDGRAAKTPVSLGLIGQNKVEILGGLASGDPAIPIGAGVLTGQRVRAVVP